MITQFNCHNYNNKPIDMDRMIFTEIITPLLVKENLPVINWLKEIFLIPMERNCVNCNQNLQWTERKDLKDGYVWSCRTKNCSQYKQKISIRKGTIFANSNLSLQTWVHLIYCWCSEFSEKQTVDLTNVSRRTVQEIFSGFRLACTTFFKENPVRLGGPGVIVQIDESCFSH